MSETELLDVYIAERHCGVLIQNRHGALAFEYTPQYNGIPLSMSMPVSLERYGDRIVRSYLMGLLPDESGTRSSIGAKFGVSGNNPFKLLACIGMDCPGAIQICAHGANPEGKSTTSELVELSETDLEARLAAVRHNAAAAWIDSDTIEEHWSLAGCQAKLALRKKSGKWYECLGSAATTHILKPGVAGMEKQALVEYISMKTAEAIGLPTAKVEYASFGSENALVIERYDRLTRGDGTIRRIHQEDVCQALGVSPDVKYAEQGGPSTPQVIDLLKRTDGNAADNTHRFILYTFFNYLIGATDGHAKNHALLFAAPNDVRLAPLYDVASIAPYRSLVPSKRKPLRCAMSIGGENRFGMLKAKHVEKMATSCRLAELGLESDVLCKQLATMARMIPDALEAVVEDTRTTGVAGIDEVGAGMIEEISANCKRYLEGYATKRLS